MMTSRIKSSLNKKTEDKKGVPYPPLVHPSFVHSDAVIHSRDDGLRMVYPDSVHNGHIGSAKPPVTLKNIAELTGLGVTTVSRALKDAPEIAQSTKRRVNEIASSIGYRPNRAGVRLRTGKTNVISLILNPREEVIEYSAAMISGLSAALMNTNMHLIITPYFENQDDLSAIRYIVETRGADGLIFAGTNSQDIRVKYLLEQGFPFVSHGRTELATPHAFVDYDNEAFCKLAVHRLVKFNRDRISLIGPLQNYLYHHHLQTGLTKALGEYGLTSYPIGDLNFESPAHVIRAKIKDLCLKGNAPNGVICAREICALAVTAGYQDAGWQLGRDFDVIVKETSPFFDYLMPNMDSIKEDLTETGVLLGKTLLELLKGGNPATLGRILSPVPNWRR